MTDFDTLLHDYAATRNAEVEHEDSELVRTNY